MGSASDMADIERFLRSGEGKKHLEEIRQSLLNRKILDITFSNEIWTVVTELKLDNGETFAIFQPSLEVDALREEFQEALEEEYYKDYPDRKPA